VAGAGLLVSPVADGGGTGGVAVAVPGFSHVLALWGRKGTREREESVPGPRALYPLVVPTRLA
jgi:hypothetical protein